MSGDSIQPFISGGILVLYADTAVDVVARALYERALGCAVICNRSGRIVGIVTDRDLACQILAFGLPAKTAVSEIMTTDVLSVNSDVNVHDVAKIMAQNGIRRIPVIEKNEHGKEKCVGIVTLDDLIVSEVISKSELSKIIRTQIHRKTKTVKENQSRESALEQKFNRFMNLMAASLHVEKELAERVSYHIIKMIVQVLSYSTAAHFINHLPKFINDELMSLPAGPNRKMNADYFINDLMKTFQLTRSSALLMTESFWHGLEKTINSDILVIVSRNLPDDVRDLFQDHEYYDRSLYIDTVSVEFQPRP